jgi:hypothetical protein
VAVTDASLTIASTNLDFLHPDGRRVPGRLWVGHPRQVDDQEAQCPVGIEGLHPNLSRVRGLDTLQALLLATQLLAKLITAFQEDGGRIVHPDTDDPFELEPFFGRLVKEGAASYRQGERIHVQLVRDEALVLFEWLARHDRSLPIEHPAEQAVLWNIEASLERVLVEPLRADYKELLEAARKRLKEQGDG